MNFSQTHDNNYSKMMHRLGRLPKREREKTMGNEGSVDIQMMLRRDELWHIIYIKMMRWGTTEVFQKY